MFQQHKMCNWFVKLYCMFLQYTQNMLQVHFLMCMFQQHSHCKMLRIESLRIFQGDIECMTWTLIVNYTSLFDTNRMQLHL